jgi:hypothetical protein
MSFAELSHEKMQELLGKEIPEMVVLVAKNMILGSDSLMVADILGVPRAEVDALCESQDYKDCHLVMAAHYNNQSVETDITYDDIESRALRNLSKRVDNEKDVDKLIRIATMANRAQRRHKPMANHLDPSAGAETVRLTLSQRIIERLSSNGPVKEEQRQISITGKNLNPTFEQVSQLLDRSPARHPDNYRSDSPPEVTLDALMEQLK